MANWLDKWVNRGLCWLLGHEEGRRFIMQYERLELPQEPVIEGLPWHTERLQAEATKGTIPFCPRCRGDL